MDNKYLTTTQVAQALEVSPTTVSRWVREGLIPAKRFGQRIIRIDRVEIERMVDEAKAVTVK